MPFVKLDTNILNSTLWFEKMCRDVFLTALLMAEPVERDEPEPQLEIRTLNETGWIVPPGKYGFVPAASVGIIRRALIDDQELGFDAMEQLGSPEKGSRTTEYEGRRLVRVDGGFIVLNYFKYRDQDYTAAARSKRYRERQKKRHAVASTPNAVTTRNITHAEAKADKQNAEAKEVHPLTPSTRGKPTLKEVIDFFGMQASAMEFWDYYESNGWKVGRNQMKDWQAAARRWKRGNNGSNQRHTTESGRGLGTANEGRSAQYAGVGKVSGLPNAK